MVPARGRQTLARAAWIRDGQAEAETGRATSARRSVLRSGAADAIALDAGWQTAVSERLGSDRGRGRGNSHTDTSADKGADYQTVARDAVMKSDAALCYPSEILAKRQGDKPGERCVNGA